MATSGRALQTPSEHAVALTPAGRCALITATGRALSAASGHAPATAWRALTAASGCALTASSGCALSATSGRAPVAASLNLLIPLLIIVNVIALFQMSSSTQIFCLPPSS